jgi:hypothetical protein
MNDELQWLWNEAGTCSTAKAKTAWSYIPLPIYTIVVSYLNKAWVFQDSFHRGQPENLFTNLH